MTAEFLDAPESWIGRLVTAVGARVMPRRIKGCLELTLPSGRSLLIGDPAAAQVADLQLHSYAVIRRAMARGAIGFANSYLAGEWSSADVSSVLRFYLQNRTALTKAGRPFFSRSVLDRLWHLRRANTRRGSRRNITAHYDLGNDFYALWLDTGMTYSSGLFWHAGMTLEEAQDEKYRLVLAALEVEAGDTVLEIGCGWGGFAEAATKAGARVTGITLSTEQLAYAKQRLGGQAEIRFEDYRDTRGQYDAIASIEMLEAVGEEHWRTYFAALYDRLKPGGVVILQAITIDEGRFPRYRRSADFIQRYIFPGGMLPTPSVIATEAAQVGLACERLDSFSASYATTLRLWRERFERAWSEIAAMGFDERFRRMWIYYLSYCEAGFAERCIDVGLYRLRKP